jgi:hypothetical protein
MPLPPLLLNRIEIMSAINLFIAAAPGSAFGRAPANWI